MVLYVDMLKISTKSKVSIQTNSLKKTTEFLTAKNRNHFKDSAAYLCFSSDIQDKHEMLLQKHAVFYIKRGI